MIQENVQAYTFSNPKAEELRKQMNSKAKFNLAMVYKLPLAYIAGVRLQEIDEKKCITSVPYKWLSQNPFKSTYFAVLAMAAEMSTGAMAFAAIHKHSPAFSMLVVNMKADFLKKAADVSTFTCVDGDKLNATLGKALATGEGVTLDMESVGKNKAGEEVARFTFTWSFKVKK